MKTFSFLLQRLYPSCEIIYGIDDEGIHTGRGIHYVLKPALTKAHHLWRYFFAEIDKNYLIVITLYS